MMTAPQVKVERMSYWKAEKLMTEFAEEFLRKEFGLELEIPIKVNPRLRSTYGQFKHGYDIAIGISISKSMIEHMGKEFSLDTVKHELVHYAHFKLGLPFRDGQEVFENALKRVGAPSTGTRHSPSKEEVYQCQGCNNKFHQSRKLKYHKQFQGSNYSCTCGGGRLKYLGQKVPPKVIELVNTGYSYK